MLKAKALKLGSSLCVAALLGVSGMASADSGDLLWQFDTEGQIWGDIKIKGKTAYFGSDDGNMYAVDIKKQELKWKFQTGDKVRSTPAFKRHWMFYTSDDGFLYAVNRKSGELFWKLDIGDGDFYRDLPSHDAPWRYDWAESSPVIKGNTLYVGSADGSLYAVSLYSGEVKWKFDASSPMRADPTVSGNLVYTTTWDGQLYALNRRTGERAWSYKVEPGQWGDVMFVSSPSVVDGKVIVGNRNSNLYAFDAATGDVVWKHFYGGTWIESSVIHGDEEGTFFTGTSDALMVAKHDAATGDVIWQTPLGGWSWATPTLADDTVYIGSTGYNYPDATWTLPKRGFAAVDTQSGEIKWSYEPAEVEGPDVVHGGVNSKVAVKNDMVFVGDLDGTLYVFEE